MTGLHNSLTVEIFVPVFDLFKVPLSHEAIVLYFLSLTSLKFRSHKHILERFSSFKGPIGMRLFRKEKGKTVQKGTPKTGSNTSKLQNQPLSADISVKGLAAFLGMDSEKVPTLLSTLKAAISNTNVEKYTSFH